MNSQDRIIGERQASAPVLGYTTGLTGALIVGTSGSDATQTRYHSNAVLGFLLPTLNLGEMIDSVTFSIRVDSVNNGITSNISLFGLPTTDPDSSGITLFNKSSTGALVPALTTTAATVGDVPNADVTSTIQSLYTGITPNQSEVFFRLNLDNPAIGLSGQLSRVSFTNNTAQLSFDVIPEPSAALLGGLGLLALLRRRR